MFSEMKNKKAHYIRRMVMGLKRYDVEVEVEEISDLFVLDIYLGYGVYPKELTYRIADLITFSDGMSASQNPRNQNEFILTLFFNMPD